MFRAADRIVDLTTRANASPQRDQDILGLLYYTELRINEVTALQMDQSRGKHLVSLRRKKWAITKRNYLVTACLNALNHYLALEWHIDAKAGPKAEAELFLDCPGQPVGRGHVGIIVKEIAAEAGKSSRSSSSCTLTG